MNLKTDGAERFPLALRGQELSLLHSLALRFSRLSAGLRLAHDDDLSHILAPDGAMQKIAEGFLGNKAQPVRAILFDKTPSSNWALGWHQDRTIAVRKKTALPNFGPWSVKSGIDHVEPPFQFIEKMVTLRAHLDACDTNNAPLLILPGSHQLGRIPVEEISDLVIHHQIRACLANAGDIWAYATSIIHASKAAEHPTHRRVLQVDYSVQKLPDGLEWFGVR